MTTTQLSVVTTLTTMTCCSCAVGFAVPDQLIIERKKDKGDLFCPNGHPQGWYGPSEAERKATQLEKQLELTRRAAQITQDQLDETRKERTALKGQLTKLRKRTGAGVCPAPGCKRHFTNLQRHIETKHPDIDNEGSAQ